MKTAILFLVLLILAGHAGAQPMPSVQDSVAVGYSAIVRIRPDYIAALRKEALDIRGATANSLGTLSASVPVADISGAGGHLEMKGNVVYAIGYKVTPIDITNPSAPVAGTAIPLPDYANGTCIWNNLLIVSAGSKTYIYSISTPVTPVLVDSFGIAIKEIRRKDTKLYARKLYGDHAYSWDLSATAPYLTISDSVDLHSTIISIDIANDQLLAKSTDTLYRFDLNAVPDFQRLAVEKMPGYPGNGALAALDTNYIGYCRYNQFWLSGGITGSSFADSFNLDYGDYYLGSGRLDNCVFYADVASTRLIGFHNATGIHEEAPLSGLTVYPNPVSNILRVQVAGQGAWLYTLRNFQGSIRMRGTLTRHADGIDVAQLPAGIYLLQLQNGQGTQLSTRIVKR